MARWDELVALADEPHLLQTAGWATIKAAAGWECRRYLLCEGDHTVGLAQVLVRRLPLGLTLAYVPRGPLVAPASLGPALAARRSALGRERAVCLLADPEAPEDAATLDGVSQSGAARSPVYIQPRRTLLIGLTPEPGELLAAMAKKTRQYIHKAERAGVVTLESDDVERFVRVLRRVAARDAFAVHDAAYFSALREAFGDRLHLFFATVDGVDAGALLVIRLGDRAWELYGGWSGVAPEHRPFHLLKWRALLRLRALGVRRYDMWGLDEDGSLAGVERFKRGFGGEMATWVGMLEAPVTPFLWPIWRILGRRRLARTAFA